MSTSNPEPILVFGDLHLHNFQRWGKQKINGINHRAAVLLASLKTTLDTRTLNNTRGQVFVFAGDVFDTNKPEPALIAALMELLGSFHNSKFYLMTGNHDVGSSGENDHSLAPFKHGPSNIVVVDKPMHLNDNILMHPWLVKGSLKASIEKHRYSTTKAVIAHGFVEPQAFEIEPNADLTDVPHLNIIAGHVHTYSHRGNGMGHAISIGAFGPTAFGDDGGMVTSLEEDGNIGISGLRCVCSVAFHDVQEDNVLVWANQKPHLTGANTVFESHHFYRLNISSVEHMEEAKKAARFMVSIGSGGVEIKLRKDKQAPRPEIAKSQSAEDAANKEIEAYSAELKLSDYLQIRIREAVAECLQKT